MLLISRRKPKSVWSAINKKKIQVLVRTKLMTRQGLLAVNEAKKNGCWTALDKSDKLILPPDLKQALLKSKPAREKFNQFSPSSRRAILEWIYASKSEETRQTRIRKTVRFAAVGQKANLVKSSAFQKRQS